MEQKSDRKGEASNYLNMGQLFFLSLFFSFLKGNMGQLGQLENINDAYMASRTTRKETNAVGDPTISKETKHSVYSFMNKVGYYTL